MKLLMYIISNRLRNNGNIDEIMKILDEKINEDSNEINELEDRLIQQIMVMDEENVNKEWIERYNILIGKQAKWINIKNEITGEFNLVKGDNGWEIAIPF